MEKITKEQLLDKFDYSAFPEQYGFRKETLSSVIDDALKEKFCRNAVNVICDRFPNVLPGETEMLFNQEHPRYKEQIEYWKIRDNTLFSSGWMNGFKELWLQVNGAVRTKEEACRLAADAWCHHMFVSIMQGNGDDNGMLEALGMYLKTRAQDEITPEIIEKVHKGIYDFYYTHPGRSMLHYLFVDYSPCSFLYDIMKDAGIKENLIESLCPWKSYLKIDPDDNSVLCCWNYTEKEIC